MIKKILFSLNFFSSKNKVKEFLLPQEDVTELSFSDFCKRLKVSEIKFRRELLRCDKNAFRDAEEKEYIAMGGAFPIDY